jgi:hypothetical protein
LVDRGQRAFRETDGSWAVVNGKCFTKKHPQLFTVAGCGNTHARDDGENRKIPDAVVASAVGTRDTGTVKNEGEWEPQ